MVKSHRKEVDERVSKSSKKADKKEEPSNFRSGTNEDFSQIGTQLSLFEQAKFDITRDTLYDKIEEYRSNTKLVQSVMKEQDIDEDGAIALLLIKFIQQKTKNAEFKLGKNEGDLSLKQPGKDQIHRMVGKINMVGDESNLPDISKEEGEVDNAVNDKLSQSLLRYMDENLSAQESQDLNRKLVETMGLLDSSNMTKEQLMAESEMDEKSSETSMRKKIISNRAKFILPTAATANFQNFVSAVVPENIAVTHESASIEFGEQIELIQQKVEANIKLTDKEQGMLDIHEEKYVEGIGYGEGLVESVLELETDTVVEASAQRGIDVGTLTEAEVEQWIADKKADPQAMKLARYIAQNSDAKILFTGKEFTYQNAVDEGMITEEQAYQKLVESGKVSEGMDAHDVSLNNALIAGFNMDNVAHISSLGDVTTVIEEVSEVYVKSRMKSDSDFVKELESFYNEYSTANPEFNKDTSMVEFFSDRAIEYTMGTDVGFDGASDTMISILDSIKALFDLIVQRALTLNRMIGEGKVSKEMQTALREAGMPLFKTDKDVKAKSKENVRQKKVSEVSNVNIEEAELSETEDELLDDYLAFLDKEENQHLKKVEIAEVDFQTAGIKSKTADKTELNKAIELSNNNTPSQEIFEKTGWFKGHDGKWKYEINDDDISFNEVSINQDELVNLSDLINHKELFNAYPSLDKVQVHRSEEHQAAYNSENNVIFIGNNHFDKKGNINATDDFTRTLLHEIQHVVQSIEGFASGTNPLGALMSVQRKLRELNKKESLSESEQGLKDRLELWSSEESLTTMYSAFAGEVEAESTADRFKSSWRQSIVPTEKTGLGVKPSFYIIADPETNDIAWVGSLVDSKESIDTLKTVQEETDFMTDEVMTEALEELDNSFEDGLVSEDIQQPNELELMFSELTFQTIFSQSDEIESTERAKLISDAKLTRSIQLTEDLANVEGDNTKSLKILSDFAQKWLKHDDNFGSYDGVLGRFEQNYTKTQSIPQSLAKTKEAILSRIATKERKEAQARISKKLNKALNETKKAKGRAVIRQDAKGNDKEILVSPEYFEELEKIKAIREMTQEAVDLALQNAIDESDIEQVHRIERWKTQKQDAGASFIAEQILDDMMEAGKVDYMKTVSTDKKFDEAFKQLALNEITGGKDRLKTQVEAKNLDMTKEQRDKYDSIENPQKKARYLSSLMKAKKLNWYKKINLEAQTLSSLMDMISQDPSKGMMEGELVNWIELLTQNADDKKDVVIEDMHDQLKDGLKRFLSETEEGLNTLSEQQLDTGIIIRDVEAQISYLDAITLLMYSENEHSKAALKNTGIGAIELKQIEDFVNRYAENHLDKEKRNNVKEFIKWTFDLTSSNNANVNKIHKKLYGVPMTFEENYLPLVIKYSSEMDKPENRSTNVVSAWHSIKTDRVNHEREIDLEGINLLHVLTNHIEDTANFLSKAQAGAQLRKVLTDVDIQAAIAQEFGQEFNTTIKNRITSWEIGEQRRNNNLGSLDKLLRNYTRARIWGKTGNFVKQLTSAIAYTIEMPFDEWAKRSFVADVSEYKTRFDTLKRLSPFLRERLDKGAGSALRTALETNSLYNVLEGESVENKIVRMGMIFTQFGDIGAIVLGGWSVFEYKKEQYLAEGKSPQAAEDAAILDFERFTARTQQSGKSKDISNIQENISPLIKLFVMFQNSQFAYWRTINAAVRALQSGKADKQKAAKALLITGLILPLAFGTATIGNKALWMALTGFGINDDEEELLKRMAFGLLMSPFSGLPSVLGSTAAATFAAFTPLEAPFVGVTPIIDDIAAWSRAPASIKTAADIIGITTGLNFREATSVIQDISKGIEE